MGDEVFVKEYKKSVTRVLRLALKNLICYNFCMEKTKKITMIVLMLVASGYFLYSGFSILFEEETPKGTTKPLPFSDN